MPSISVITPIYNTASYLDQCIQSILAQTYTNWELLLIDDGSTDSSGAICDKYAKHDTRIRIIHQPNQGLSATRKRGIDNAKGDYIIFLDSDDYWIDNEILSKLLKIAEQYNADVVRGEYIRISGDSYEERIYSSSKIYYNIVVDEAQFLEHIIRRDFFIWLAMFKKSKIEHVKVNPQRAFLEDMEFWIQTLTQPLKCVAIPEKFYGYRQNPNSITNTQNIKKTVESFSICEVFNEYQTRSDNKATQRLYQRYGIMNYYWALDAFVSTPRDFQATIIEKYQLRSLHNTIRKRITSAKYFNIHTLIILLPFSISTKLLQIRSKTHSLKHKTSQLFH